MAPLIKKKNRSQFSSVAAVNRTHTMLSYCPHTRPYNYDYHNNLHCRPGYYLTKVTQPTKTDVGRLSRLLYIASELQMLTKWTEKSINESLGSNPGSTESSFFITGICLFRQDDECCIKYSQLWFQQKTFSFWSSSNLNWQTCCRVKLLNCFVLNSYNKNNRVQQQIRGQEE